LKTPKRFSKTLKKDQSGFQIKSLPSLEKKINEQKKRKENEKLNQNEY